MGNSVGRVCALRREEEEERRGKRLNGIIKYERQETLFPQSVQSVRGT